MIEHRRKIEDHVHGQWVKEEKEKEEKNRNSRISGMARILSDVL